MKLPVIRRFRFVLFILCIATVIALFATGQRYMLRAFSLTEAMPRATPIHYEITFWYLWAAFTVPIFWFAKRIFGLEIPLLRRLIMHVPLAVLIAFLHILFHSFLLWIGTSFEDNFFSLVQNSFVAKFFMRVFLYFLIASACYAYLFYLKYREDRLQLHQLESQLSFAQLQTLRMQMNPAFVFATLTRISELLTRDVEEADTLTARLGHFLRQSLEYPDTPRVPLECELELVKAYLAMKVLSSEDGVIVELTIDPDAKNGTVPNLILQQLLEMVFEQKISAIKIHVSRQGNLLRFKITGAFPHINSIESAVALRDRLSAMYRNSFELKLLNGAQQPSGIMLEVDENRRDLLIPVEMSSESFADARPTFHLSEQLSLKASWKMILGVWTIIMLFFLSREVLQLLLQGETIHWMILMKDFVAWYWWAIFTPLIFSLASRYPVTGRNAIRNSLLHCFLGALFAVLMVILYTGQRIVLGIAQRPFSAEIEMAIQYPFVIDVVTYWAILGVGEALKYYGQIIKSEDRNAGLKKNLTQAQVHALRMQMQPHFLFNTLNTLAELMHEDPEAARRMLNQLDRFLRMTLENERSHEVALKTELEFLENYLAIQKVRFQDRLQIDLRIDPAVMKDRVPNLILQPIVENAIRHAIAPKIDPGTIEIEAKRKNGVLHLLVRDDGPGLSSRGPYGQKFREGLGISNTRARLEQLYGNGEHFKMINDPRGGLRVEMQIPQEGVA